MKNKKLKIEIGRIKNGDVFTDYGRAQNPFVFRYQLQKTIIEYAQADVTFMVNTNQRIQGSNIRVDEAWLNEMHLQYTIAPAKTNPQSFFGFSINKNSRNANHAEKRIMIDIACNAFSEELYMRFKNCDIALGIGRIKTFEETCEHWKTEGEDILFNTQYFKDCLYDSVLYTRMRSTFDTERYIKVISDEVGI